MAPKKKSTSAGNPWRCEWRHSANSTPLSYYVEFFFNLDQSHSLYFRISMPFKLVCLYNGYSAGFTVIIYFVLYTLVPLVGLLCALQLYRSRANCMLHCVRRTRMGRACFGYAWSTTCSLRSYNHGSIYSCLHINVFLSY